MYQIRTARQILGYADDPRFCYRLPSGSPQIVRPSERDKATGLIYGGKVYNLPGHSDFDGETATAAECDAGAVLNALQEQNNALESQLVYTAMMTDTLAEEDEDVQED